MKELLETNGTEWSLCGAFIGWDSPRSRFRLRWHLSSAYDPDLVQGLLFLWIIFSCGNYISIGGWKKPPSCVKPISSLLLYRPSYTFHVASIKRCWQKKSIYDQSYHMSDLQIHNMEVSGLPNKLLFTMSQLIYEFEVRLVGKFRFSESSSSFFFFPFQVLLPLSKGWQRSTRTFINTRN